MPKSIAELAHELLSAGSGGLEELRVHEFHDDGSAHDDAAIHRFYEQFRAELNTAVEKLNQIYGSPVRTGTADDVAIPLGGVFSFAVWDVDATELFIAAAHEDRGVPILLMLGTG